MAHAYNLVGWGTGFEEMERPEEAARLSPPIGRPPAEGVDLSGTLKWLLARNGRTQAQIARYMRVDSSIVSLWAKGVRRVPVARLSELADALGVAHQEIAPLRPPPPPPPPKRAESDLARWLQRSPLEQAGMTTSTAHATRYEFSCLNCGRGTGRDGAVGRARALPLRSHRCAFCGGFMLCEELMDRETSRLARDLSYPSVYRDEREVA